MPSAQVSSKYDASIDSTIADIQAFWTHGDARRLRAAVRGDPDRPRLPVLAETTRRRTATTGARRRRRTSEVAGNAFYCSNGDFVAYDEQGLLPKLRDNFGEFAVGLVFAHELGHAVQARVGYNPSATVYMEQQADCFAGAWAQHVADSNDSNVHLSDDDLDTALAGLLTLSDPSGIDGATGRRARQRLRPGQRVPGRLRGRRAGVRRLPEQPARRHRVRLHELRGPGERRQPAARRA